MSNVYEDDPITQSKRAELLGLLTSMGYKATYAQMAIEKVDPHLKNAAELCFHWMEENPEEELQSKMSDEEKQLEKLMEPIVNMGFTREQAINGLKQSNNDISKAIMFILGQQADNLKKAIGDEEAKMPDGYDMMETDGTIRTPEVSKEQDQQVQNAINTDKSNLKSAAEVENLSKQIVELQQLVLTYQTKYVDLKKKTRQQERERKKQQSQDAAKPNYDAAMF